MIRWSIRPGNQRFRRRLDIEADHEFVWESVWRRTIDGADERFLHGIVPRLVSGTLFPIVAHDLSLAIDAHLHLGDEIDVGHSLRPVPSRAEGCFNLLLVKHDRVGGGDGIFVDDEITGTVIPVTNWSLQTVTNKLNHSLLNVKFLLAAVTTSDDPLRRASLTDATSIDTPTDQSGSRLTQIYSKISEVGGEATAATFTNSSQVYITNASAVTSYSYIASGGGQLDASTLGGAAPFPIEIENPATNRFIELKASNVSPKPAATIVGTFSLTSAGVLTFSAGPPVTALTQSHIQSIARSGSVNTVTFSTAIGANYRLRYTTNLVSGASIWTILPTSIAGDGSNKTLTDTTSDPRRFYVVEAYH